MYFEEKIGQNKQKTYFLTGKDLCKRVCTCRTLANECQRNMMFIDRYACVPDVFLQIIYSLTGVYSPELPRTSALALVVFAFTASYRRNYLSSLEDESQP